MGVTVLAPVAAAGTNITPAIFGLVGVLVGALISAGMQYWLQKRAEEAEREAQERRVGASTRLVLSVLEEIYARMQNVLDHRRWYPQAGEEWTAVWSQERSTLAAHLEDDEFRGVANGFVAARMFDSEATAREGAELDDESKVEVWLEAAGAGADALRPSSSSE